jgi:hypothetical protein
VGNHWNGVRRNVPKRVLDGVEYRQQRADPADMLRYGAFDDFL